MFGGDEPVDCLLGGVLFGVDLLGEEGIGITEWLVASLENGDGESESGLDARWDLAVGETSSLDWNWLCCSVFWILSLVNGYIGGMGEFTAEFAYPVCLSELCDCTCFGRQSFDVDCWDFLALYGGAWT